MENVAIIVEVLSLRSNSTDVCVFPFFLGFYCPIMSPSVSPLQSNVFMYYGLSNFYQNHRRYVKSRDDSQLNGDRMSLKVRS